MLCCLPYVSAGSGSACRGAGGPQWRNKVGPCPAETTLPHEHLQELPLNCDHAVLSGVIRHADPRTGWLQSHLHKVAYPLIHIATATSRLTMDGYFLPRIESDLAGDSPLRGKLCSRANRLQIGSDPHRPCEEAANRPYFPGPRTALTIRNPAGSAQSPPFPASFGVDPIFLGGGGHVQRVEWKKLNGSLHRDFESEASVEQRRNARVGETGGLGENPPTSGIVWSDSHMRKYASGPAGNLTRSTQLSCADRGDMEQQCNAEVEETRSPREIPLTNCTIRHVSRARKFAVHKAGFAVVGTAVAEWLERSPITKANQVRFPEWLLPDSCTWKSCQKILLVGEFFRGSPSLHSGVAPHLTRFTIISSQKPVVERRPDLSSITEQVSPPLLHLANQRRRQPLEATVLSQPSVSTGQIASLPSVTVDDGAATRSPNRTWLAILNKHTLEELSGRNCRSPSDTFGKPEPKTAKHPPELSRRLPSSYESSRSRKSAEEAAYPFSDLLCEALGSYLVSDWLKRAAKGSLLASLPAGESFTKR
ncbi:hypothetical protein PR048_028204 [Dryococelus australis]|uniref:Uncharacterized protein n=1 Tax=Dryococelus australis TaxID=614101 RepID=A0ABQ9GIN4_9NEOP|nr:hypothetical protein PR048_028204 [Dryococelus australis]